MVKSKVSDKFISPLPGPASPQGPNFGYSTHSSLSREMRALGPAIEDVDLSDTEEADVTEEVVAAVDVTKTSTNKPAPQ